MNSQTLSEKNVQFYQHGKKKRLEEEVASNQTILHGVVIAEDLDRIKSQRHGGPDQKAWVFLEG